MENNKVSIITPYFNSKSYFSDTFKSVLSQTYKDWEWIIVDDRSTDGSREFLRKLETKDKRIKVIFSDKNSGTAHSRNVGLKLATGKYITFLDSDDMIDEDYLESQVAFIQEHGPLITASYRRKTPNSCTNFIVPEKTDYKNALKGNPMSCLTTMFDRTVIKNIHFDETFDRHEDYIFWLEILKTGIVAYGNKEVLATYVLHEGSKNSKKIKLLKSMFRVYHKTQHMNWFRSLYLVINYVFYSRKKYKSAK